MQLYVYCTGTKLMLKCNITMMAHWKYTLHCKTSMNASTAKKWGVNTHYIPNILKLVNKFSENYSSSSSKNSRNFWYISSIATFFHLAIIHCFADAISKWQKIRSKLWESVQEKWKETICFCFFFPPAWMLRKHPFSYMMQGAS